MNILSAGERKLSNEIFADQLLQGKRQYVSLGLKYHPGTRYKKKCLKQVASVMGVVLRRKGSQGPK